MREKKQKGLRPRKKQEELRLRKRKKIVESPTQSPLPSSPDSTPEKMKSPENAKLTPYNPPTASNAGNAYAPPARMITFLCFYIHGHDSSLHF